MTGEQGEAPSVDASPPARGDAPGPPEGLPLLWPFVMGTVFVLLILLITVLGGAPSPEQFQIYRIVIALGGAGFAVALTGQMEVRIPLMRNGLIKATAGFAVFVILYFFSPAALVVDDGELRVERMLTEYRGGADEGGEAPRMMGRETAVAQARLAITARFASAQAEAARADGCDGELPTPRCRTMEADLQRADALVTRVLDAEPESFDILNRWHLALFDCVDEGDCDRSAACAAFIPHVEPFRQTFCDRLEGMDEGGMSDSVRRHRKFVQGDCGAYFVDHYIKRPGPGLTSGELYEDLEGVCLPTQCWARNMMPPYPCAARLRAGRPQLIAGIAVP